MSRIVQRAAACAFSVLFMFAFAGCAEVGRAAGPTIDEAASASFHPSVVIAIAVGGLIFAIWIFRRVWLATQNALSSMGESPHKPDKRHRRRPKR